MLQTDLTAGVLRLTLNRSEVRNALNETLIAALRDAFESVPQTATAVVLRGAGKAFCAGGDLDYMRRMGGFS
ncbi:MAG: enoyl-CoA hydratase, partial [Armatimonadota bacterium]